MKIGECPECVAFYRGPRSFMLIEACASVGLSNGKSTKEMLVAYISAYHNRGHRELDRDTE